MKTNICGSIARDALYPDGMSDSLAYSPVHGMYVGCTCADQTPEYSSVLTRGHAESPTRMATCPA